MFLLICGISAKIIGPANRKLLHLYDDGVAVGHTDFVLQSQGIPLVIYTGSYMIETCPR